MGGVDIYSEILCGLGNDIVLLRGVKAGLGN
jgi:hypothetical protein